jgi:molybdopterin-containing oxidoreductase family membrane subunit
VNVNQLRPIRMYWLLAVLAGAVAATGLAAAHFMETRGHIVTGMGNEVVWGLPHVFAIFMIVAASGVLNVASVGSVFGQAPYKARARLAGLLALALLAGGLMVLMLDLGRPDRVIVAATHYNFRSVFAWNVFLYSGMAGVVIVYLWTMFEPGLARWTKPAGIAVLVWRFILTTGTGSIFGFLVARQAYQSAVLAPLFIVLSLAWGMAVFVLVQAALSAATGRRWPDEVRVRMARLLGIFVAASLYFVAVQHMTNGYEARRSGFEAFVLLGQGGGTPYALLFWVGFVLLGSVLPMLLVFHPQLGRERGVLAASALVVLGAFAWLFAFIVGGQAFPLEIFPGAVVSSSFHDGMVASYAPSLPELLLGLGGVGAAFLITTVGVHLFDMAPRDAAGTS